MSKWILKLKHNTVYINTPKMKFLGINLAKYVQDLYEEKYKTLMNEMKERNAEIFHVYE